MNKRNPVGFFDSVHFLVTSTSTRQVQPYRNIRARKSNKVAAFSGEVRRHGKNHRLWNIPFC
jgi:hypothetical protein